MDVREPSRPVPASASGGLAPGAPVHLLFAAFVATMLAAAFSAPALYRALVQEDRLVEWGTVALFLLAGTIRFAAALRGRRAFDLLVALFCIFVAGEEISWGQRLLGLTPAEYFLEHNFQQEANVHNFLDIFGRPKWILAGALAGYGLLLPALARTQRGGLLLSRLGATSPRLALAPWFALAVLLLALYPVTYTGEWVEALAGGLFLAASPVSAVGFWAGTGMACVAAAGLSVWSAAAADPDGRHTACAAAESEALLRDLVSGSAARPPLARAVSVHKRVYGAADAGYLDLQQASTFHGAGCEPGSGEAVAGRRRYAVDPWGMAYWVLSREIDNGARRLVAVYSLGPNRLRDGAAGAGAGDDISAYIIIEAAAPRTASR